MQFAYVKEFLYLCALIMFSRVLIIKYCMDMKEINLQTSITACTVDELNDELRHLIEVAKQKTQDAYCPYSHFHVGAAALLDDGTIITGANQENAAYPVGCCAERTALFWCGANRPGEVIKTIAIAAQTGGRFTKDPIAPCGMCRQALLEVEHKQGSPITVLLYGEEGTHCIESIQALMPLTFNAESMDID